MKSYTIDSPLRVKCSSKKLITLSWNALNTCHFRTYAKAKRTYSDIMKVPVKALPRFDKISVEFKLFPATKRLMDLDNICGGVAKFFLDTLAKNGKIEDDNWSYIPELHYLFGEVDKANPRMQIIIKCLQ